MWTSEGVLDLLFTRDMVDECGGQNRRLAKVRRLFTF